jgi:hypothetical protein
MHEINWCLFLVDMFVWKKSEVQFSKSEGSVLLAKSDVLVCQTGLSGFGRQNI